MAESVDVPGAGKIKRKQVVVIVGAGAAYVGYRWWKSKTAPTTGPNAAVTGTTPGTLVGTDASGQPVYENAAGQLVDSSGNPDTLATGTVPGTASLGYANPDPNAPYNQPAATGATTDQQWTQAVVNDLAGIGYDETTVATALAAYLASQPLTPDQVTIVRTAWAYEGRPPQHPNLNIVQTGTAGTIPSGGGSTVGALKPGDVVQVPVQIESGQTWATIAAKAGITAAHLQANNPTKQGKTGDVINVPVEVKGSATWQSIAGQWGITAAHLQANNPTVERSVSPSPSA